MRAFNVSVPLAVPFSDFVCYFHLLVTVRELQNIEEWDLSRRDEGTIASVFKNAFSIRTLCCLIRNPLGYARYLDFVALFLLATKPTLSCSVIFLPHVPLPVPFSRTRRSGFPFPPANSEVRTRVKSVQRREWSDFL